MNSVEAPSQFLQLLRAQQIPVGVREVERLHRIFALQPAMDRQQVHDTLCCVLIKTPEQRDAFEVLFAQCYPHDLPEDTRAPEDETAAEPAMAAEVAAVTDAWSAAEPQDAAPLPAGRRQDPGTRSQSRPRFATWRRWLALPRRWKPWLGGASAILGLLGLLTLVVSQAGGSASWPRLVVGVLAWLLAGVLWWRSQPRGLPDAVTLGTGPLWQPLPAPDRRAPALLEPQDVRGLVWNMGRFVSEELTRKVDLARTATATARAGGHVVIRHQPAVYLREVWLWVDEASRDSTMWRLAAELQHTLERAGLPCRQGVFWDTPEVITWETGQVFSPLSVESHRQHAMVLVLSDGRGLSMAHDLPTEQMRLLPLLRGLSAWPHLAFVEMGHGQYHLSTLLRGYGLLCLAPAEVAAFLGAREVRGDGPWQPEPVGLARVWAAGLALAPEAVDDHSAYALRAALRLAVSPWDLAAITACGQAAGAGYVWPPERRAAWVNWLLLVEGVEQQALEGVAPATALQGTRLKAMLEFWRARYDEAEKACQEHSPARYRLAVQRAVLDLWSQPEEATRALFAAYRTAESVFGACIREQVSVLVPVDTEVSATARSVRLPWRFQDQSEQTQWMLLRMGFASATGWQAGGLHLSGVVALQLGCCLGLGALSLLSSGPVGQSLFLLGGSSATWYAYRQSGAWRAQRLAAERPDLLDMVELPGGTFRMGSADDDEQAYGDERPRHQVTISPVRMSRYVITRGLYRRVVFGVFSSEWLRGWRSGDSHLPVTSITWFEALAFCNKLSERQGLRPCYRIAGETVHWDRDADGYRLPTEAEWEYAARAGSETRWLCGDTSDVLGDYAWFSDNAADRVHAVGGKAPNPWGLYDMAGNVWEWCWDWYGDYAAEAVMDPPGPAAGAFRVLRGGAYWLEAWYLRSANRSRLEPENRYRDVGFRVVRRPRRQP